MKASAGSEMSLVSGKYHEDKVFAVMENRGDFCRRCTKITLAHGFVLRILFILFDVKIFEGY